MYTSALTIVFCIESIVVTYIVKEEEFILTFFMINHFLFVVCALLHTSTARPIELFTSFFDRIEIPFHHRTITAARIFVVVTDVLKSR